MSKKNLSSIRTASIHGPVLVSPISVAHRNKAMEAATGDGKKGGEGNNHVRAQWIANLKKKSMATEGSPPTQLHHQDHLLQQQHACMLLASENLSYDMYSGVKVEPKATVDILPKKWIKPLLKKRNNALDIHSGPKPRTPRRKLNCGNAFEEMQIQTNNQHMLGDTAWGGFPGVGTPSAHYHSSHLHPHHSNQAHAAAAGALLSHDHLFGPDMDFGCNFDTFLDLPTPKSAEMPNVVPTFGLLHDNDATNASGPQTDAPHHHHKFLEQYQVPPTLVRTSSVEQEGLSYCLGQTRLHSSSSVSSTASNQDDNDVVLGSHRSAPGHASSAQSTSSSSSSSGCLFDHTKHPELEGMFDYEFNDDDIDKEVDNFYMADGHDLEIDLIA